MHYLEHKQPAVPKSHLAEVASKAKTLGSVKSLGPKKKKGDAVARSGYKPESSAKYAYGGY